MKNESPFIKKVQAVFGRVCRLFRNNTGRAWQGQQGANKTLTNIHPVNFGLCVGSSDIIGLKPVIITPDMVGKKVAVFVAIETKSDTGTATPEQIAFIKMVLAQGGMAGVARTIEDVEKILNENTLFSDNNTLS